MSAPQPDEPLDFATAMTVSEADAQERELLVLLDRLKQWLPPPERYRILDHLNAVASDLYGEAFEERHS